MLVFNIRYVFITYSHSFGFQFFLTENRVYILGVFDSTVYLCNKFLTKYPPDTVWNLLQHRVNLIENRWGFGR